ncbi:MAG: Thermonuclease precursor [Syntrophorhabdus sp. PtaU1.Bin153]|nr:MAG: Thermonuclease precursor [Syntrophorhabdus sp. PtaU1.Bin153]
MLLEGATQAPGIVMSIRQPIQSVLIVLVLMAASLLPVRAQERDLATVIRVVDGNILKVEFKGKKESVRLIGIDAPECKINRKAKRDAIKRRQGLLTITSMGIESARYVRRQVKKGDTVILEFDVRMRDKYGRLLSYVYLVDGRMLNEEILRAGYAYVVSAAPNVKYQDRFQNARCEAKKNRRGLWREI